MGRRHKVFVCETFHVVNNLFETYNIRILFLVVGVCGLSGFVLRGVSVFADGIEYEAFSCRFVVTA